ncbi:MAG: hypothetical protein AB7D36_09055 [Oscillospiraceae bacterium]
MTMAKKLNDIKIEKTYIAQKDNWTENTLKVAFTAMEIKETGIVIGDCVIKHDTKTPKEMTISINYEMGNDLRYELKKALDKAVYFDDGAWYFLNVVKAIMPEYKFR